MLAPEGQPFDQLSHFFGEEYNVFCSVVDIVYYDCADDNQAQYKCDPIGHVARPLSCLPLLGQADHRGKA